MMHVPLCESHSVVSNFCDRMDCSPPGSSVHGILQPELEWVAIPFSGGSSRSRDQTQVSLIAGRLCTIWAARGALYVCMSLCMYV